MRISIVFHALLVLQCFSTNPQLPSGQQADQRTDANSLFAAVEPRVETGDAQAQYLLRKAYANGCGVPRDYAEATIWWTRAAEQGSAAAQNELGCGYLADCAVSDDIIVGVTCGKPHHKQETNNIEVRSKFSRNLGPATGCPYGNKWLSPIAYPEYLHADLRARTPSAGGGIGPSRIKD